MRTWDEDYKEGVLPWDLGHPEPLLVAEVEAGALPSGRLLEIGCGTGDNARFLAGRGCEVTAIDLSPTAVALAADKGGRVTWAAHDVLADPLPGGPYDAVFDRGCFHVFDDPADRARFASRVSAALRVGGVWLTLAGSTEGPPRETGPPRRSMRDLAAAIEPHLEIIDLRRSVFANHAGDPAVWVCRARKRDVDAAPSTLHDPPLA